MPYPEGRADVSALTGNQTSGGAPPFNDFMIEGFIVADLMFCIHLPTPHRHAGRYLIFHDSVRIVQYWRLQGRA
jgi:hypothetical protein